MTPVVSRPRPTAAPHAARAEYGDQAQRWWGPIWRGRITRALVCVVVVASIFSAPLTLDRSWLDLGLNAAGFLVWLLGGSLRFWATLYIGGRKGRTVVDEGPYSLCRNPLYVGSLLLAISAAIFLQSPSFAVAILLLMTLYARGTVPGEERTLHEKLGQPYAAYAARVPRYWPRLRGYHGSSSVDVNLQALRREYRRAMLWLWLPWIGELTLWLQHQAWWPHFNPLG